MKFSHIRLEEFKSKKDTKRLVQFITSYEDLEKPTINENYIMKKDKDIDNLIDRRTKKFFKKAFGVDGNYSVGPSGEELLLFVADEGVKLLISIIKVKEIEEL